MIFTKKENNKRGRNWMSAMGVLFIVMAMIIAIRNIVLVTYAPESVNPPFESAFARYFSPYLNNEKFVIAMLVGGGFLLWWGYFKKKDDEGPPDEHERRRFGYDFR
jgi:hypothetical protein